MKTYLYVLTLLFVRMKHMLDTSLDEKGTMAICKVYLYDNNVETFTLSWAIWCAMRRLGAICAMRNQLVRAIFQG